MKTTITILMFIATVYIAIAQSNYPTPRTGHTLTMVNDTLYLFGGEEDSKVGNKSTKSVLINTIFKYKPIENKWTQEPETTPVPEGRKGHSAIGYNGEMYVFGGQTNNGYSNEMWKYNPQTQSWVLINITGLVPYGLKNHSMIAYNNNLYILGGENENGDNPYCYKIDMNTWVSSYIGQIPAGGGKKGCSVMAENGYIILAGGINNGQTTGTISIYNTTANNWTWVQGNNIFAFAGTYSNWIMGGSNQTKKSTNGLINKLYSCTFTPPATFTMTEVSSNIPAAEYFNSFVEYISLTPNFELDTTFFFWGGANNDSFYRYKLASNGSPDTLSIYDTISENWIITTSIKNITNNEIIQVYPNPVQNKLYVSSENNTRIETAKIYNIFGQEILRLDNFCSNEINVENLNNGMYIIELETKNSKVIQKIIKQ